MDGAGGAFLELSGELRDGEAADVHKFTGVTARVAAEAWCKSCPKAAFRRKLACVGEGVGSKPTPISDIRGSETVDLPAVLLTCVWPVLDCRDLDKQ